MVDLVESPSPLAVTSVNDLTVAVPYVDLLRANDMATLDALFAVSKGQSMPKAGLSPWRERIRITLKGAAGEETFYLKRFNNPPNSAQRIARRSGTGAVSLADMEWAWSRRIAADGIACPVAIAFGQELSRGREKRSAILMAAVGGNSLERRLAEETEFDPLRFRNLIAQTAEVIARFHKKGYVHRDLYLSHVFYDAERSGTQAVSLIDLHRVLRPTVCRRRWRVKDLASLNFSSPSPRVSRADRLRWLKRYLGVARLDAAGKCLALRVIGKTRAIARHDRRRRARVAASGGPVE